MRPVRKKQAIRRYEQEFTNLKRGTFNLDDYDASYEAQYCFSAEEDGESASTYDQVLRSKYKEEWMRAMESEIKSLKQHHTWTLQDLPSDKKSIGCKWVFRIKRNPNGEVVKFKARLVAKGFTQRPGVDYFETFAPVARKESINVALAIAAEQDMIMENVDVDTAFLYGEVKEVIYTDQPDGFADKQHHDKKCLLNKALYGTKQAAREWNHRLNAHLEGQGFTRTAADLCVYVRRSDAEFSLVIIHVDDCMLFAQTQEHIDEIKRLLKTEFSIKELGELKYCLGIELTRDREKRSISMNQRAYIKRLADQFGVDQCKDVHTPSNESEKLTKLAMDEGFVPKWPYRELVGALMYVATCTRPDIMHAVGEVAKHCERYGKRHWIAAKRVLKYLKTTADFSIVFYGKDKGELLGYADASWASDLDSRRSTTGYVFFLHGNVVSWKSKRQPTVATSSTEAEYMALYAAAQEAVWLRLLLSNIRFELGATTIYEDNQGCIRLAKNTFFHTRAKHIDIKFHFLREKVEEGVIVLGYKPTDEMIADGLTKALGRTKHAVFLQGLNLKV